MILSNEQIRAMLLKVEYEIARQKMSKREFYEKSGVSSSLYSQWNTGAARPTMKSVGRIAEALGLSVEFLIGEPENEKSEPEDELAEELRILKERPDLKALLHVGAKTSPASVKKLRELMETMQEG